MPNPAKKKIKKIKYLGVGNALLFEMNHNWGMKLCF